MYYSVTYFCQDKLIQQILAARKWIKELITMWGSWESQFPCRGKTRQLSDSRSAWEKEVSLVLACLTATSWKYFWKFTRKDFHSTPRPWSAQGLWRPQSQPVPAPCEALFISFSLVKHSSPLLGFCPIHIHLFLLLAALRWKASCSRGPTLSGIHLQPSSNTS